MATLKNTTINDTGFVQLPVGTTGQRPGTPATGMIRYNTDYGRNEIYDGAKWVLTNGSNSAGGGTVTSVGGYNIHTFTTVGATTFTMNYPGTVEILLVGGGGGGAGIGGGGGAGGYFYESQVQLNAGAYTINVGGGGGGEPSHNSLAAPGSPTSIVSPSFTRMQAVGGGRGLPYARNESPSPHGDGGSGGGGPGAHGPATNGISNGVSSQTSYGAGNGSSPYNFWHQGPLLGTQTGNNYDHISLGDFSNGGGHGVMGQGHPGGSGAHGGGFSWAQGSTTVHSGGGGGGAGSSGKPVANGSANGNGGVGLASQISGTITYYAGGGGSGTHQPGGVGAYGTSGAQGGQGGGGVGGGPGVTGGTGGTNTGGGGGGGMHASPDASGPGGPGIAIIRYRNT